MWGQGSPLRSASPQEPPRREGHKQHRGSGEVQEGRGFPLAVGCTNAVLSVPFKTLAGLQAGVLLLPRLCEGLSRIHEKS